MSFEVEFNSNSTSFRDATAEIRAYFASLPHRLFYIANPPDQPGQSVGLMIAGQKQLIPDSLLDWGSNVFLMSESIASSCRIVVHPIPVRLNTSNGATAVLGVTAPIIVSYGAGMHEVQREHCFLVVRTSPGACFKLLIGNSDALRYGAAHDTVASMLIIRPQYPVCRTSSERLCIPIIACNPPPGRP
jgi:hypothetical protein